MDAAPRIGVVIPTYNSSAWIESTLASVLAQAPCRADEIVVVDDGSRDDSVVRAERVAARHERVRVICRENGGPAAARNSGFALLSPAIGAVLFLDADDELEPGALGRLRDALAADPAAVASYGLASHIDEHGQRLENGDAERWGGGRRHVAENQLNVCAASAPTTFEMLAVANWISTPGQVLVRAASVRTNGGFDERLRGTEDWDLWLRLSLGGHFRFLNERVVRYRQHADALSRDARAMTRNRRAMFQQLLHSLPDARARTLRAARRFEDKVLSELYLERARRDLRDRHLRAALGNARRSLRSRLKFVVGKAAWGL